MRLLIVVAPQLEVVLFRKGLTIMTNETNEYNCTLLVVGQDNCLLKKPTNTHRNKIIHIYKIFLDRYQ